MNQQPRREPTQNRTAVELSALAAIVVLYLVLATRGGILEWIWR